MMMERCCSLLLMAHAQRCCSAAVASLLLLDFCSSHYRFFLTQVDRMGSGAARHRARAGLLEENLPNFRREDCSTFTIHIPIRENWIVQGRYNGSGVLSPLDARFSSGNLSISSNAGVVLRYLSIEGQTAAHTGGGFDYRGGDGQVLVFEHVHIYGCAAKYGGAINIGNHNGDVSRSTLLSVRRYVVNWRGPFDHRLLLPIRSAIMVAVTSMVGCGWSSTTVAS